MNFFLPFFGFLAVGLLGFFTSKKFPAVGKILLGLGIAGSVGWLGWSGFKAWTQNGRPEPSRYQAVIGYQLGHLVARELAGQRGTVCLVFPPESGVRAGVLDTWFETFARVLSPFPALEIKESILDVSGKKIKRGELSQSEFQAALAKVPQALAYVSFAGVPDALEKSVASSGKRPLLFAYDARNQSNWVAALKQGFIRAVIVPRPGVDQSAVNDVRGPPDELFERFFAVVTPQSLDSPAR